MPSGRTDNLQIIFHEGEGRTRGLGRIFKRVRQDSIPLMQTWQCKDANKDVFNEGPINLNLAREDGGDGMEWTLDNPNTFITQTCSKSPRYQMFVEQALQRFPCSAARPWSLTIAFDELVPGNQFDGANGRKTMASPFAFVELGRPAFADPRAWMAPVLYAPPSVLPRRADGAPCSVRT